jgi:hypothetical protein
MRMAAVLTMTLLGTLLVGALLFYPVVALLAPQPFGVPGWSLFPWVIVASLGSLAIAATLAWR